MTNYCKLCEANSKTKIKVEATLLTALQSDNLATVEGRLTHLSRHQSIDPIQPNSVFGVH